MEMDETGVERLNSLSWLASADFQDHFIDELGFETGE